MKKKFEVIDRKGWFIPETGKGYNWKEVGEEDSALVDSAALAKIVRVINEPPKKKE